MMWTMGFGWLGMVLMVVFWVAIVALAVWLLSRLFPVTRGNTMPPGPQEDTPLEILKRRYARGEITQAEYEAMRRELA